MIRRRSPPPLDTRIPADWIQHDGQDCPVAARSRPAVMFRTGLKLNVGFKEAWEWENYDQHNCWVWLPGSDWRSDIVAYQEEPHDYVAVPNLGAAI